MALKKTNYELKELGIVLPEAYAFIHRIECDRYTETVTEEVNGEISSRQVSKLKCVAEFYVQNAPRESAIDLKPFERHIIHFTCKASENPLVAAYETAKGIYRGLASNQEAQKIEEIDKTMPFSDWENDIVEETDYRIVKS